MWVDTFQEQTWKDKYRDGKEDYKGFCRRIASSIFPDDSKKQAKLFNNIYEFKTFFGGRINANIGTLNKGVTLFNCFIEAIEQNPDSLEGIMDMVKKAALTLKTEGGVGFCANFLRPTNTLIRKIGVTTPGSIKFLELFDKASEVITSGSVDKTNSKQGVPTKNSIRKGAMMVTMSVCHPDIVDFIHAKSVPNKLTKMNMSVLITDAFIEAVKNKAEWCLWFPDITYEKYDAEWDGDFEKWAEKKYPLVVYEKVQAVDLWDEIMKNSYNRNEPGVLFIDNARRMDNLHYLEGCNMLACNPCVVEGTLVATNNGLVPVELIKEGHTIQTTLGLGINKKTECYRDIDLYRVTFSDGFYQDVTAGHIFHTMDNDTEARKTWNNQVRLKDLKEGQFVRKQWYNNFPNRSLTLTRDDGLLIGLYLGDGSFSNNQCFNISTNATENNKFIEDLYTRLGGDCRVDTSEGECVRYYMTNNNKYLNTLFSKLGINTKGKLFDILKLVNTNEQFILGLIDGLLSSDGNVNLKGRYAQVRLDNSSNLIHFLMKHLMLFVKADYKKYLNREKGDKSIINGREVTRKKNCYTGIIENDSILNLYNAIGYLSHEQKNELLKTAIMTKNLNGVKWKVKVKSIAFIGKGTAYDLYDSVADDWNHEGYVSRGCAEVFGNTGNINYKNTVLTLGDICNLGSVVVTKYYDIKTKVFDMDSFLEDSSLMVEALDNVADISEYPLEEYRDAAQKKRKIGVGVAGVGSLFMMMNLRYGSEESVIFLDNLLSKFINRLYQASALLAKEKGPFELYDEAILTGGFIKNSGVLTEETLDLIKKYGLRNSALGAIAPNGTLSILAGNVSGGVEPVFSKEITRWYRVEGKKVDFKYPNIHKGEWFETDYFKEDEIYGDKYLMSKDGEYRIDKNNGLCKRIEITDYGYKVAKELGFKNVAGATELSVTEHLNILAVFSKYIDQSSSKTINLPADVPFEDFKALYKDIHSIGVKGCTTYREGSMVAVLEGTKKEKEKTIQQQQEDFLEAFQNQNGSVVEDNVSLPEEYPAKGYILRSDGGKKWYVHVAFKDRTKKKPFALFVNTNSREDNVPTFNALEKLESLILYKGLNQKLIEETKQKYAYQKNPVKICRVLGLALRHNISVLDIVRVLDEVEEAVPGTFVFRIKKFLAQFIDKIEEPQRCPACGERALLFQEGCFICSSCGNSKCG